MNLRVHIPTMLRSYLDGAPAELSVVASSVHEALLELSVEHRPIYQCVCNEAGAVRQHINLFVNSSLIRSPEQLHAQLQSGDELFIMTAVSGG